ncbi:MAG: hypothetical protein WC890_01655 [Candidatus Margulisiibacteriota bacterium]
MTLKGIGKSLRFNHQAIWPADNLFVQKLRTRFASEQMHALLENGHCDHAFQNGQSLFFILRAESTFVEGNYQFRLEALDFANWEITLAGFCDFSINIYRESARTNRRKHMPEYDRDLCRLLWDKCSMGLQEIAGFSKSVPDEADCVAFWINPQYRFSQNPGFDGLSNLLFGTAVLTAKGLGVEYFEIRVGNCFDRGSAEGIEWYQRTANYYQQQFGAIEDDPGYSILGIRLK